VKAMRVLGVRLVPELKSKTRSFVSRRTQNFLLIPSMTKRPTVDPFPYPG